MANKVGGATFSAGFKLAPARYLCNVVPGAGAGAYLDTCTNKLTWNANSPAWTSASWERQRLAFSYEIDGDIFIGKPIYTVKVVFDDLSTINAWAPEEGDTSVYLDANLMFNLAAVDGIDPRDDQGSTSQVQSVFPYRMDFQFDGFAAALDGAMLTGENSIKGTVVAVHGVTVNPAVVGLYHLSTDGTKSIIAVHAGQLLIDGVPAGASHIEGSTLRFAGLTDEQTASSGLPTQGSIDFSDDGHQVVGGSLAVTGARTTYRRLAADGDDLASPLQLRAASVAQATSSPVLATLLNQTQFAQDDKGAWSDAVQTSALADFYSALKFHMDPDLRKQFLDPNPVDIDPDVRAIAELKGKDGSDPTTWYQNLSVVYLTNVLRLSSDPAAAQLNALRAQEWSKSQVAQSPVYQVQGPAF